ncbi:MAG TPA: hypothetical protein VME22_19000 [Solirubrobacteraceae bacterium]|nr:hypothetical protein [Solirubrobacteraceae bacterium]
MKGPWKALAFLAAVAGTALVLSTSAFALDGGAAPAPAQWRTILTGAAWSGRVNALFPGAANDIELRSITVTNHGHAKQRLSAVTASIRSAGGNVQNAAGAEIRGCRASWFAVSVEHASRSLPALIPPGDSYTAKVAFTMRDAATNQNACRGAAPAFTVTTAS